MHRQRKIRPPAARTRRSGWLIGTGIGGAIVAVVVTLVSAILAYARSIGDEAPLINSALKNAERNTAPLRALRTTIEDADAIVDGLQRGRVRLGG